MNNLVFEKLDATKHDRESFDCGEESLNVFLKLYASQHQKKGFCVTHVCFDNQQDNQFKKILGYYTISASSIESINVDYFNKKNYPIKIYLS